MNRASGYNQGLDTRVEATTQRPTPREIENTIKGVLETEGAARLRAHMNTCVHCGLCARGCHLYHSNDHDGHHTPAAKVRDTMGVILRRRGRVDTDFMQEAARIAYTECTLCRRCSMHCPFGLDTAHVILMVRRMCFLLGLAPLYAPSGLVNDMPGSFNGLGGLYGNAILPLDREGAELMYLVSGQDAPYPLQLTGMITTLMAAAGVNWTMASAKGWEDGDLSLFMGDFETMARIGSTHYDKALKLRVKRIVTGECDHAFRSLSYDCPRRLGWKQSPVPVLHAIDLYHDLIISGRLKIRHKIQEPVTVHDPCTIIADRPAAKRFRSIVKATCADFREMRPRGENNYCCGAGGGMIYLGSHWKGARIQAGKAKAEQLRETRARLVITPCPTCYGAIQDISTHYTLDIRPRYLLEVLMECIGAPDLQHATP